jgi:hypothetical protein
MDSFDSIVDAEVRESRKPKITPPPGMVGTSAGATARHRIAPHKTPKAAAILSTFAWIVLVLNTVGSFAFLSQGVIPFVAVLLSGAWFAAALLIMSVVVDRLDAAAHWSRQTAEALHQYTASRND